MLSRFSTTSCPDEVLESARGRRRPTGRSADHHPASLNRPEAPVVTLVDRILLQAMSVGASDIHVNEDTRSFANALRAARQDART